MEYNRGDSFPSDYEPNGSPFVHDLNENYQYDYIPLKLTG